MYVQEYSAVDKSHPNYKYVYLAYLDSVKYFEPDQVRTVHNEALRTFVYHQILVGYLDHCKQRGFAACYIWASPPRKGENYIFYCHPEYQKTPQTRKLCEWYMNMIKKAKEDGIIIQVTNPYDVYFRSRDNSGAESVNAICLPFFDGDHLPDAVENSLIELEDDLEYLAKGTSQRRQSGGFTTRTRWMLEEREFMLKLGPYIERLKDEIIIVQMQPLCSNCGTCIDSGNKQWCCLECEGEFRLCKICYKFSKKLSEEYQHPAGQRYSHNLMKVRLTPLPSEIVDDDDSMDGLLDNREDFLELCQSNAYQFDTLRRAKHSSMMILYDLHHRDGSASVKYCEKCRTALNDKNECLKCNHKHGAHATESPQGRVTEERVMLAALVHVTTCPGCTEPVCQLIKRLYLHSKTCEKAVQKLQCNPCDTIWHLLTLHAKTCETEECHIPRCSIFKHMIDEESRECAGETA